MTRVGILPIVGLATAFVAFISAGILADAASLPLSERERDGTLSGHCRKPFSSGYARLPPSVVPEGFGVNFHYSKGPEQDPEDIAMIAGTGFRFVREDMRWEIVETVPGNYDFSEYDRHQELLSQAGLRPLYILQYGNLLYESHLRAVRTPEGRRAFAAFAAAAARRYADQGIIWEIWNEPNLAGFWQPAPSAEEYFALIAETSAAVRRADPLAVLVAPATSLDFAYLGALLRMGLLHHVDAISVHPYRFLEPPETAAVDYGKLRALLSHYAPAGRRVPIVSSEWGYSAVTHDLRDAEALQARYLVRQHLVNLWQGVPLQIWFTWRVPQGEPPTPRWAIVGPDRTPTPALHAAATLMHALAGYEFVRRLRLDDEQAYVLLFRGCRRYALALWLAPPGINLGPAIERETTLPLRAGQAERISILGGKEDIAWDDSGLHLTLSEDPQYIILESTFPPDRDPLSWSHPR